MVSLKDARYQVLKNLFGPLVTDVLCPTELVGEGNLPARGPGVLVCNHRSLMDPYLVSARSKRVVNWVMAPFVSSIPLFGWLAKQAGAVSIIQAHEGKSEALIAGMEKVLRQGRLLGIFPEGMDSFLDPPGPLALNDFHSTFMRVVLKAGLPELPVIPAAIYARGETSLGMVKGSLLKVFDPTERAFDQDIQLVGYREALVVIGKPLRFDEYYARYVHASDHQEPLAQSQLVESLVCEVQRGVACLLERAALLDSPSVPLPIAPSPPIL